MIDCTQLTDDQREQAFGREFRSIPIISYDEAPFGCWTKAILGGEVITLIGDPQDALRSYLACGVAWGGLGGKDIRHEL